jgi:hypothetical protein
VTLLGKSASSVRRASIASLRIAFACFTSVMLTSCRANRSGTARIRCLRLINKKALCFSTSARLSLEFLTIKWSRGLDALFPRLEAPAAEAPSFGHCNYRAKGQGLRVPVQTGPLPVSTSTVLTFFRSSLVLRCVQSSATNSPWMAFEACASCRDPLRRRDQ